LDIPEILMAKRTDWRSKMHRGDDRPAVANRRARSGTAPVDRGQGSLGRDRAGPRHVRGAREAGVTREALYKALSENGDLRLTTLLGVARALGVTLTAHVSATP
jgi:hypothetical protein